MLFMCHLAVSGYKFKISRYEKLPVDGDHAGGLTESALS
jgi:hypothetical protein